MNSSVQYLRWGEQSPEHFSWFRIESGKVTHRGESSLESIAEAHNHSRIVLLVPTKEILLTEVELPTRNPQKIRQVVPYALEEQLIEDVDELHFAIDTVDSAGRCGVAVVKRAKMVEWLKPFDDAGIRLAQITPDVSMLPVTDGEAALVVDDNDDVLLRLSQRVGYALSLEELVSLLNGALSENEEALELLRIYSCGSEKAFDPSGLNLKYEVVSCDGGIEQQTAEQLSKPQPIDMLQGEFSRKEQLWRHLKPWPPIQRQFEPDVRMGQGQGGDHVVGGPHLTRDGTEELPARGRVEEQTVHGHRRTALPRHRTDVIDAPARYSDLRAFALAIGGGERKS